MLQGMPSCQNKEGISFETSWSSSSVTVMWLFRLGCKEGFCLLMYNKLAEKGDWTLGYFLYVSFKKLKLTVKVFVSMRIQQGWTEYRKQVWFDMISPMKDSEWWLGNFLPGVIILP